MKQTSFAPTKQKAASVGRPKTRKETSRQTRTKERASKKPAAAESEVRRTIALDYVTTGDVDLRAAPDLSATKLSGGLLARGTVVQIEPQDWWYVEVDLTASGVLRGWVSNALLRRATEADKNAPAPPCPTQPTAPHPELRKKMAASIVQFEGRLVNRWDNSLDFARTCA